MKTGIPGSIVTLEPGYDVVRLQTEDSLVAKVKFSLDNPGGRSHVPGSFLLDILLQFWRTGYGEWLGVASVLQQWANAL